MLFRIKRNYRFLWILAAVILLLAVFFVYIVTQLQGEPRGDITFGVTFSQKYAGELGLDWRDVYTATLEDLGVKHLRLPVYWDVVEPTFGRRDFSDVDEQVALANKHGVQIVMAVGMRLPRWPECHVPAWTKNISDAEIKSRLLEHVERVVNRYKTQPHIVGWQVENEPFLGTFGKCPPFDEEFFAEEVRLVRSLDPSRPITVTESGELSSWLGATEYVDTVGVSLYRVTWNRYLSYFYYPLPPLFYSEKAKVVEATGTNVVISELQAEPWGTGPLLSTPMEDQMTSMSFERFQETIDYARRTQFEEIYLWGVEWWYWMREMGRSEYWEEARVLF